MPEILSKSYFGEEGLMEIDYDPRLTSIDCKKGCLIKDDVTTNLWFRKLSDGDNTDVEVITLSPSLNDSSVALGEAARSVTPGTKGVGIGYEAGKTSQGNNSVAIGPEAGKTSQGASSTAVGGFAGSVSQGVQSIAIGYLAGQTSQDANSIAIGYKAGNSGQGNHCIAIGREAGNTNQGNLSSAIGLRAGKTTQGASCAAFGYDAGTFEQGAGATAFGYETGMTSQGTNATAVGREAGQTSQGANAVAIGRKAGETSQGAGSIAIGHATINQGVNEIVIGDTVTGKGDNTASYGNASTLTQWFYGSLIPALADTTLGTLANSWKKLFLDGKELSVTAGNLIFDSKTVNTLKNKYDATTAPGVDNDTTEGYAVGSHWIDVTNDNAYTCVDITEGAAVWPLTNGDLVSTLIEYAHKYFGDTHILNDKLELDGSGDYLKILYPLVIEDAFDGSGDYTIEIDVKSDATQVSAIVSIGHGTSGWSATDGHTLVVIQINGDLYFQWNIGGGTNINLLATTDIQTSQVRLTFVRSGGRVSMYNGVNRINSTTTSTAIVKPTGGTLNMKIGVNDNSQDFDGQVDGIRISNIAWYDPTDTTITNLSLTDDDDVVYLNTFTGIDGLTPALNTEN